MKWASINFRYLLVIAGAELKPPRNYGEGLLSRKENPYFSHSEILMPLLNIVYTIIFWTASWARRERVDAGDRDIPWLGKCQRETYELRGTRILSGV